MLPVADTSGKAGVVLMSSTAHLHAVHATEGDAGSAAAIHLPADNLLTLGGEAPVLSKALSALLSAAIALGSISPGPARSGSTSTVDAIPPDAQSVFSELLKAMIARLAGMIDALQVGANTVSPDDLAAAIAALKSLTRRVRDGDPV